MSWKGSVASLLMTFGLSSCLTDLENACVTQYNKELSNDPLVGTWYWIQHISLFGTTLPAKECLEFIYEKPNATDLARYKAEYLKPNISYSFDDTPVHLNAGEFRPSGVIIGNKEAKFFIMDPSSPYFRPPFTLRIYQRITDDLVMLHDCSTRGYLRWLMSKSRNFSREEVESAALSAYPELNSMVRRWYCR